jgi:acetylglutamate kinase
VKVVVKIGGAALDDASVLRKCAHSIVELAKDGHHVAVIHGGGGELTRTMQRLGKTSEFVDGLRVTDAETRDMALMVLAGMVNKRLVAAIGVEGKPAIGLCGGDGATVRARKKECTGADLGYVGEICAVDPRWIEAIWGQGGIPVGCQASALIFLTDVAGVKDADGAVIRWLGVSQIAGLVETAVVKGGMLPKLEACRHALSKGVGRVRILPAAEAEVLPQFYFAKLQQGTEVRVA